MIVCKVDKGAELADKLMTDVENRSRVEVKDHIAEMIRSWKFNCTLFIFVIK